MDITNLQATLAHFQGLGYLSIFILMVIEGPVITGIAAFLSSLGFFNIWVIVILGILGNLIPDVILFQIGQHAGNKALLFLHDRLHINVDKTEQLKTRLHANLKKGIVLAKLTPGLAPIGLITIGITKPNLKDFIITAFIFNLISSSIFSIGGYYMGFAFLTFANLFNEVVGLVVIGILLLILLPPLLRFIKRKYLIDKPV